MPSSRRGFTIIEVLVAIVILATLAVGVARFASSFTSVLRTSSERVTAAGIAEDRLQLVRADPRYTSLVTLYNTGAGADTTGFQDFPKMHRVTKVVRDVTSGRDRTTVTVRVSDPAMTDTVSVTSVIASP